MTVCGHGKIARGFVESTIQSSFIIDMVKQKCVDLIIKQCLMDTVMEDCYYITKDKRILEGKLLEIFTFYLELAGQLLLMPNGYERTEHVELAAGTGDESGRVLMQYQTGNMVLPPPPYESAQPPPQQ